MNLTALITVDGKRMKRIRLVGNIILEIAVTAEYAEGRRGKVNDHL